jgi:Zn finger protein HypA/HybF involved in hydrogenase expression
MRGLLSSCSEEKLREIINKSLSYAECLRKLGYVANSGTILRNLKNRVAELNIDTSHFDRKEPTVRTRENVFIKDATCSQAVLRRWFLKEPIEYKCSICGSEPFWNGKEMIMVLDHINGENHDNRLGNLRWVCPNCNSQLETTNGKNRRNKHKVKHENFCSDCGKPVSRNQTRCRKCASEQNRKVERPPVLEFAKMVKEIGFQAVGKKYGLSGKAVQKWCEDYKIPHKKVELVDWYNEQVGIIDTTRNKGVATQPKPVKQINIKTGEVINIHPSLGAAASHVGATNTYGIGRVCRGLQKTAHGFMWEFV